MKAHSGIAVLAALAVFACGAEPPAVEADLPGEARGTVGLTLRPVAGIDVNEVHFVVTKGGTLITQGDLPTPGTARTVDFALGLPVGVGYLVSVSGASVNPFDDVTCTGSFGPFNILPNQSVNVSISLLCVDNSRGNVGLHTEIETEACPRLIINYAVASPSQSGIPGTIAVLSSATDLDGLPVTYAWSVDSPAVGNFTSPNAANTTFNCSGSGDRATLTVTADNGQCDTTLATKVSCIHIDGCGNGVLDPGEDCDPSLSPCPADCTVTCGDGVAEAPVEECDPPVPGQCNALCQASGECGDAIMAPGEQCDDGNLIVDDGCHQCVIVDPPFPCNGDGVPLAGELCDAIVKYSIENCGADCQPISSATCQSCAVANCAGAETCVGTPNPVQCNATLDCVRDSGCADGGFALFCYCGAVSSTECDTPGLAAGACRAEIEAGLGNPDPIFIQNNLFDIGLSAGRAMARVDCELGSGCSACF
jgi:cysteine-rich repeat protein